MDRVSPSREGSHQKSPLVRFLWSGPKHSVSFLGSLGFPFTLELSHESLDVTTNPKECKDALIIGQNRLDLLDVQCDIDFYDQMVLD